MSKKFFYKLLVIVFACAIAEVAMQTGWLEIPDYFYYDFWHQLAGPRHKPEHVVIVAIDDQTQMEHHDEPLVFWGPNFARAIEVLRKAGVRIIGLDYLFSVSAESWLKKLQLPGSHKSRTYDIPLREQLTSGKVVLAATMVFDEQGKKRVRLPIWDYWHSLPGRLNDVGLTNFYNDIDGTIRKFTPLVPDDDGRVWVTLGKLLAEKAAPEESTGDKEFLHNITFVGPPGTFPRLPFRRLLRPGAEIDPEIQSLKGKVIIIASESSVSQDMTLTPYTRSFFTLKPQMMSGAELHANIVETLLTRRFQRPVSVFIRFFCLVMVVVLGTSLFFRLSPWQGLAMGALINVVFAALSFLLFRIFWILPIAGVQLGLIISYLGSLGVRLTGEERERARLRHFFGRYVSEEVVQKLLNSGKWPNLGGEALQVTVLFADIRDFTTISETLNPQEVVEILNTFLSRACEPILEQGGTIDKFMGDAIMAVFGAPVNYPDHARRAVSAALAIVKTAEEFRSWMSLQFAGKELPDFRIGIGIHTGEAIVGNIGSPKKLEFTAIGDSVNMASRLETLSKKLKWNIVASSDTMNAAGDSVVSSRREKLQVKGRKKDIEVFEVIGLKDQGSG
jgi:adenylate cyclase